MLLSGLLWLLIMNKLGAAARAAKTAEAAARAAEWSAMKSAEWAVRADAAYSAEWAARSATRAAEAARKDYE